MIRIINFISYPYFFFILNSLFKLDGIVYAQPVADIVTTFLGIFLYLGISKEIKSVKEDSSSEEKEAI